MIKMWAVFGALNERARDNILLLNCQQPLKRPYKRSERLQHF